MDTSGKMKVRVKSIEAIEKIGIYKFPDFITDARFESPSFIRLRRTHSMEYYCGKVIELDENGRFDYWYWASWMYDVVSETPLLEVEE